MFSEPVGFRIIVILVVRRAVADGEVQHENIITNDGAFPAIERGTQIHAEGLLREIAQRRIDKALARVVRVGPEGILSIGNDRVMLDHNRAVDVAGRAEYTGHVVHEVVADGDVGDVIHAADIVALARFMHKFSTAPTKPSGVLHRPRDPQAGAPGLLP